MAFNPHFRPNPVGSISSVLNHFIVDPDTIINDGENITNVKEIAPESQMPANFNEDIVIRITDNDFTHTCLDETFL